MPTPVNRTPIRVARGTYANLNSSIADIQEGEVCYATDQDKLYVKEGGALVSTQGDLSAYLTTATAASTYQTQAGMSGYLATGAIGTTVQAYDVDTAKTDVAQSFTAPQRGSLTTLTISSGAVAIDFNSGNNFYLNLNAAVNSLTFSNATAGQTGSIFIRQDAAYALGGWPGTAKFSGGSAPTITATAGKYDRIDYAIYDSSNVHLVWTGNY